MKMSSLLGSSLNSSDSEPALVQGQDTCDTLVEDGPFKLMVCGGFGLARHNGNKRAYVQSEKIGHDGMKIPPPSHCLLTQ